MNNPFDLIEAKLNTIEALLLDLKHQPQSKNQPLEIEELLTVENAAKFLSLSVATIYGLISKHELPVMKRGKRCYFSKQELITYLKAGRKKTNLEIKQLADSHLRSR